jgi:hypothetical protein
VPPDEPGLAPADDVPWLSALSWSWCVPNAPVTAKMTSTAAAPEPAFGATSIDFLYHLMASGFEPRSSPPGVSS